MVFDVAINITKALLFNLKFGSGVTQDSSAVFKAFLEGFSAALKFNFEDPAANAQELVDKLNLSLMKAGKSKRLLA